jgi:hypothetical protein
MIEPRPCGECRRDVELARLVYVIEIDAKRLEPEICRRLCPRCARAEFRRRRFGLIEEWAAEAARWTLERFFGEDLRITWLQQGDRRWAVLCRRRWRPRPSSEDVAELTGRAPPPARPVQPA